MSNHIIPPSGLGSPDPHKFGAQLPPNLDGFNLFELSLSWSGATKTGTAISVGLAGGPSPGFAKDTEYWWTAALKAALESSNATFTSLKFTATAWKWTDSYPTLPLIGDATSTLPSNVKWVSAGSLPEGAIWFMREITDGPTIYLALVNGAPNWIVAQSSNPTSSYYCVTAPTDIVQHTAVTTKFTYTATAPAASSTISLYKPGSAV